MLKRRICLKSRGYLVGDLIYFLYPFDSNVCFRGDTESSHFFTVRRSKGQKKEAHFLANVPSALTCLKRSTSCCMPLGADMYILIVCCWTGAWRLNDASCRTEGTTAFQSSELKFNQGEKFHKTKSCLGLER